MTPVEKALWFVESHFADEIALDDIAAIAGVSSFYLVRAFGAATGRSLMHYVRSRRLTVAAHSLAHGAPDILAVALEAGYGSHGAFTRAFRDAFGVTPEQVRADGTLANLALTEAIKMKENPMLNLSRPRFIDGKPMLIAGLSERYDDQTIADVPALWQRFTPFIGNISGQIGEATFGVGCNGDGEGSIEYIAGVEVKAFEAIEKELARIRLSAQKYAVFAIPEHVSAIRRVWNTIWNNWVPESGHEVADAPFFERYGESFDPRTGAGGFEIWVPVKG